jgi:GNAT superfamily N-acetyltransferase
MIHGRPPFRHGTSPGSKVMNDCLTTSVPGLTLRQATPDDIPQILAFIRELAEYERLAHEVVASPEQLRRTLFGDDAVAEVILAERDGEAAGFALFFHNYSTFLSRAGLFLEDLFVRPAHRGTGTGRALLTAVARLARARGCGRMEWNVLNWNTPAIEFYEALGAAPQSEWTTYRLAGDTLARVAEGND